MKKEISWSVALVSFFTIMIGGIALAGSIVFMQTKAKYNTAQANNQTQSAQVENKEQAPVTNAQQQSQETQPTEQTNLTAPQEEAATSPDTQQQIKSSALTSPENQASFGNGSSTTFDNLEAVNNSPAESRPAGNVKISARIDDNNPEDGYTTRLIVSGPQGGVVTAICPIKANPKTYYARLSYITGKAIIPIKTKDAYKGEKVVLDINVNYQDQDYKTTATFLVR